MLRRLVEDGKPDQFAVVFDAPGKTFRDDWYPEYKANRPAMPDDLARQIEPLHDLIRAYGWPLLMIEGVEADDVIGTLVRRAEEQGFDAVISTGDKDLAQLITPHVTLVNTMSNEKLDLESVVAKFGVRADQILDLLTLTGDAVDNVPGVAKVGPKTAAKWLAEYGTLDQVIAHAGDIGGVVGENLRAALDWLPQGRKLLTVKTDCALPVAPTGLIVQPVDSAKLRNLLDRFEFKTWLKDLEDGRGATTKAVASPVPESTTPRPARVPVSRHYETILDMHALERWIDVIELAEITCFDTETTSLDPMQARIVGLSFAVEPGHAAYIPLVHRYAGAPAQLPLDLVLARLKPWFENPAARKLGQNVKYDQHVLANHGIALAGVEHDTMLQSYVLESHRPHDMDSLAWRRLDVKTLTYAEVAGKGASQIGFDQVSIERATEYSAEDADIALQLHLVQHPRSRRGCRSRLRLFVDRDADARSAVSHGAHRRASRLRIAR